MTRAAALRRAARGVTLVEMIAVLVIIGVVASLGARLFVAPVTTLMSSSENATLAEQASQATRRLEDDLGVALANSVRVTTGTADGVPATFLELVPVQTTGRYRMRAAATGTPGDPLDFENAADSSFDVLGPMDSFTSGTSALVINNLGTDEANVYTGNNRRANPVLSGSNLSFTAAGAFPVDSPSGRFAIVGRPVTWICSAASDGSGTLVRVAGYDFQATQPAAGSAAPLAGASERMVAARGVTGCSIVQDTAQANLGLLRFTLELVNGNATARVVQQYALDNTP